MLRRHWMLMVFFALLSAVRLSSAAEQEIKIEAETGLGYDSNIFFAPDDSYFSPFDNGIVNPEKQSGVFVPLELNAEHLVGIDRSKIVSGLKFRGKRFIDSDLSNGDSYWSKLESTWEYLIRKKGPFRDRFFIGPHVAYNKEIYFDRDTGDERQTTTTDENIAARFEYVQYGLDAQLRIRSLPVKFALKVQLHKRDYEDVPVLDSLDHSYQLIGGDASYDIRRGTRLKISIDLFERAWDDRRARDLNGDLQAGTDRRYTYQQIGLTLRQKFGRPWTVYFDIDRLERTDEHVGYNDYTRHRFRIRSIFKDDRERRVRIALAYWDRYYPRAFAFDDPNFDRKDYETWEIDVRGEMPLRDFWMAWSELEFIDQMSADPRYDYQQYQIAGGIGVRF